MTDTASVEMARLHLIEEISRATLTPELRSLARAAIELAEGQQQGLPPGPWSELKMILIDAALAFGKVAKASVPIVGGDYGVRLATCRGPWCHHKDGERIATDRRTAESLATLFTRVNGESYAAELIGKRR